MSYVLLIELGLILIVHWFRDHQREDGGGLSELLNHDLHEVLDLDHLGLHSVDLGLLSLGGLAQVLGVPGEAHAHLFLLLLAHDRQVLVFLDLSLDVSVLLLDGVDL